MLEYAYRVRRSNYSYEVAGSKVRIFPQPRTIYDGQKLFVRVMLPQDPLNPAFTDNTLSGSITGPHNAPFGNIPYTSVKSAGRHWIREYTYSLSKEILGLVRSKFDKIPIPNNELTLNGEKLISDAKEEKKTLIDQLREFFGSLTQDKLMELDAAKAESLHKQLIYVPMLKPIVIA
jgi:hypothetical protein